MNRHSQKGSALLIVLGFLSFMVVSAVAFAIWMRNERLPSSALRRNVANRYLVKAALAQAMSRVDDAIRSHPYPGAWSTTNTEFGTKNVNVYRDKNGLAYDWWESRVFMPPDPEGVKQQDKSNIDYPRYAPVTKTVSVLNLEALGYLPPEIVNDVRLLSRSSWAAQWEYFNFDAGRYAFCAVNVSDLLDINKLAANSPRTSAAPARPERAGDNPPPSRFSLVHLFRDSESDMTSARDSNLKEFDEFVHEKRYTRNGGQSESVSENWKQAPFVSLMDYNLGMGVVRPVAGLFFSPFSCFVSGETRSGGFYGGVSDDFKKRVARQPFVTDSWFPRSDYEVAQLNLMNDKSSLRDIAQTDGPLAGQPFVRGKMNNINNVIEAVQEGSLTQGFKEKMMSCGYCLSTFDPVVLYDYLDENNVPLSLAIPCAERVPMVTALGPEASATFNVEFSDPASAEQSAEDGTPADNEVYKVYDIKIKVTPPQIRSGLVFPFMSGSGDDSRSYDVQAFMRLVFVDEGENPDADKPVLTLRSKDPYEDNEGFASLRPKNIADWKEAGDKQFRFPEGESNPNSLLLTSFGTDSWKPNVTEPKDVYKPDGMKRNLGSRDAQEAPILRKIEVYEVTKSKENPTGAGTERLKETKYRIMLRPFNADGTSLANISMDPMPETEFDAYCAAHNIRPYLMVWVRVKNGDETVDMVPAMPDDDEILNQVDNSWFSRGKVGVPFGNSKNEQGRPVLHFPSKMMFTYVDARKKTDPSVKDWVYKSCYALDPRYNWAPENWFFSQEEPTLEAWYRHVFNDDGILNDLAAAEVGANADNPRGDRARDPILFVSNLGYLQSVGELAFLPRLSLMEGPENMMSRGILQDVGESGGYNGSCNTRDTVKNMPCAGAAWKSYQNYRTNADPNAFEFGANLYRRGLINPQQGFYVNPFTKSKEVMLAAFANTPLNYWVAGTNYQAQGKSTIPRSSFDKNYVFDSDSQLRAGHLAEYMMHRYEDLANMLQINGGNMTKERSFMIQRVWADMFDALDWGGRLKPGKIVEEVYEELNDYYRGGDAAQGYKDMYIRDNGYSALNYFVTQGSLPGITLDLTRATHLNELADPLYYYSGYSLVESTPEKEKDLRNPDSSKYICDADRMFLHSYWRDCFANRQQLFLIFVRAESTALGGNGEGTPAQQGGRAVALVWRDPEAPMGNDVYEVEGNVGGNPDWNNHDSMRHPHKMRILFYRQLD